jgi:hypothetical protein
LFAGCVAIFLWSLTAGFGDYIIWRHASLAITNRFLPILGIALGFTILFGVGLPRGFRILALIVALVSVIGGMLAPALAE